MQKFYEKALTVLIALLVVQAVLAGILVFKSYLVMTLLPSGGMASSWRYGTFQDAGHGGKSTIRLLDTDRERLAYGFRLDGAIANPYVDAELVMQDGGNKLAFLDVSRFDTVTFVAACSPANALIFGLATFDERWSKPGDFPSYPSPQTYFSCNEAGVPVSLDITRLSIPPWWFDKLGLDLPQQAYRLDQVAKIYFGTTLQSPVQTDSRVEISKLVFRGRDTSYLYAAGGMLLAGWLLYGAWFLRAHQRALRASLESKLNRDLPLVAYRQLTLEPSRDKEKGAVLRFIAGHYSDPQLDLEQVASGAGVNRTKVNEVLKSELGMTFTAYLNKLRLSEAARMLRSDSAATVAHIADTVGYVHVSYFNKLFKEEYGCTPKAFRGLGTGRDP